MFGYYNYTCCNLVFHPLFIDRYILEQQLILIKEIVFCIRRKLTQYSNMDTMADDSSFSNHTESNYSLSNEVNSTATMPLSTNLGISLTGNQSIIYYTVGVFGLVSNVYVIIVVALNKSMHKHLTNIYIINQSTIDGLASAILILQTVFQNNAIVNQYTQGNIADEALCRLWYSEFPLWGLMDSSTYNIVALTIERYLAIVHPIWYKTKFSNNKFMIGLSICFCLVYRSSI